VTFEIKGGDKITLRARDVGIGPRFEVFPISVSEEEINEEPEIVIDGAPFKGKCTINILHKSEWSVSSSEEEKDQMVGDATFATTQTEGKESEIPNDAIDQVTLHAGIEIQVENGNSFIVATSMFPFALYVSNCEFSELVEPDIYERIKLC